MEKKLKEILKKEEDNFKCSERKDLMYKVQNYLQRDGIEVSVEIDDDNGIIIYTLGRKYALPIRKEIVIIPDDLKEIEF